jgi:ADP-heptose:LPS heptosyltransferase
LNLKTEKLIDKYLGDAILALLFIPVRCLGLLLKKKHDFNQIKSVCIVKLMGGGSLFIALPSLLFLKSKGVKLSVVCGKNTKAFAESMGVFDHVLLIDDSSIFKLIFSCLKCIFFLHNHTEATIDLELHSRITTIMTTLSMVRTRLGLVDSHSLWRKRIYTHSIYVNSSTSAYAAYDAISSLWGNNRIDRSDLYKYLRQKLVTPSLSLPPSFIGLGVGCSIFGKEREASIDFWKKLIIEILNQTNYSLVFIGGPEDKKIAVNITTQLPSSSKNRMHNFCGSMPLAESIYALDQAKYFMGIDSALLHFAMMLGVHSIGIWGPTHPASRLKFKSQADLHLYKNLSCSPCVHVTENPPCAGLNLCMNFTNCIPEIIDHLKKPPVQAHSQDYEQLVWVYNPNGNSQSYQFKVHT